MAKKKTSKKPLARTRANQNRKVARKKSDQSGFSGLMMVILAIAGFGAVSPGAAIAIFICMLPTFVLLFGNADGLQSLRAQCVGYLNAAAAFPFVYSIYNNDTTFVAELMDMKILLAAWGAALVGTFLQYIAPLLAASFLQLIADEKLEKIKVSREKLIEEWGPEVTGIQENEKSF